MNNPVYLVGRVTDDTNPENVQWTLAGIFDDEKKAEDNCTTKYHFVRPLWLNRKITTSKGALIYFPKDQD